MNCKFPYLRGAMAPLALVMTLCAAASRADVPVVDPEGKPAIVLCKTLPGGNQVKAVHMDKIIFRVTNTLLAANPVEQQQLNAIPLNSVLDIKVLDDPKTVADLKAKVLSFLGAVVGPVNRSRIEIDDVDYAVVCPNPDGPIAGG